MKRVLVTGASGFIGRHCLAPLRSAGYEVHAIAGKRAPVPVPGVTWHAADLHDAVGTASVVDEVAASHLMHLAWSFGPGGSDSAPKGECPDGLRWVLATINLVRRFRESGGQRAVIGGTSFEYDWADGLCVETGTLRRPTSYYGTCKNALFELLTGYADAVGLSMAWSRIFFLYGPHEPQARLVASVIRSILRGEPALCSQGTQIRDYLYVEDVAEALVATLDSNVAGPVNIGSQQPIALRDLIGQAAELLGRLDLLRLGALPTRPTDAPLVLADITRLREEVGWRPRFSHADGLDRTIAWWREQAAREPQQPSPRNSTLEIVKS
jgi:nucleoside-diphosphate-sugar epimerase